MTHINIKNEPFISKSTLGKEFMEKNKNLDKLECLKFLVEKIGFQYTSALNFYYANTKSETQKRKEESFKFIDEKINKILKKELLISLQYTFNLSHVTARKYLAEYENMKGIEL